MLACTVRVRAESVWVGGSVYPNIRPRLRCITVNVDARAIGNDSKIMQRIIITQHCVTLDGLIRRQCIDTLYRHHGSVRVSHIELIDRLALRLHARAILVYTTIDIQVCAAHPIRLGHIAQHLGAGE